MDIVQLSILRAGGVHIDERAVGEWERLRDQPALRLSPAKAEPQQRNWLLKGLAVFVIGLSDGLAGLGRRLQERAARSTENAAMNGYKAT